MEDGRKEGVNHRNQTSVGNVSENVGDFMF